ncbi:MAG TPA: hypothetical protein EYO01_05035 [Phycisphaerales bacterium]|nr:hypothetical protein [Phycisphaerales bacterium]HIN83622.1 hypothetical protein [Phycisphaerales bacterium]
MSRTIYITNGIILIQLRPLRIAHSITITDGLVRDIDGDAPAHANCIDLEGKTALPGLIDSHLHLVQGASGMGDVDLRKANSKDAFRSLLLEAQSEVPEGQWLVAHGWKQEKLGGTPDKSWFPNELTVPTLCYRIDFHSAVLNDIAINQIPHETILNVTGGSLIESGVVKEDALYSFVCPKIPSIAFENKCKRTIEVLRNFQSKGITLVGSMEELADVRGVLMNIPLKSLMRVGVMSLDAPTEENIANCLQFSNGDFIRVFGFKAFLDGSLGSRTAKMYEPWSDTEGNGLWAGVADSGELTNWVKQVCDSGFAPVIHAIGDAAVGKGLEAFREIDNTLCPRIEHAQFISEKDIPNIKRRMFGVQPLHQPDDAKIALEAVGETREKQLHNWRRMLDSGARLSFGSDWPVASADPIAAIKVAVNNGVTIEEAMFASTEEAALSLNMPLAGTLTIDSYGDVVVLDCNPFNCDWTVTQPEIYMTILGGTTVYMKEQ